MNKDKILVKRIEKMCPVCKIPFFVPPYKNKQKYCSVKCRNSVPWNRGKKCPKISDANRGRKSWNRGLTKKTDIRVAKFAQKLKGIKRPYIRDGNNPSMRPEVIEKLRRLNLGKNNPQYGKKLTTKHREALLSGFRNARKNKEKSKLWDECVSRALKGKPKSKEHVQKIRIATLNREIVFPQRDTSIEIKLKEELKKRNLLKYFEEHSLVRYICRPDLVSFKLKLAVFYDGDFWHANPKFLKNQNLTKILQKEDWKILRFWESEINEHLSDCVDKIENLINGYRG